MGRAPCCDKTKVKRGPWSPQEDATLKTYLQIHGTGGNWIALPQKAGLNRCGKSCRLRWLNYLRPDIKHGGFTEEEDHIIINLYSQMGSRWSLIASHLPGRTDNDVKNYWNTKLKKQLLLGGNTSQEIKHSTSIISPVNYTNNPTFSCSPVHLLPFVPKSEPNSSSLFTFKDSITPASDTLPSLSSDIIGTYPTMSLDPVHQFSYPSVIIDHVAHSGSNLISNHIVSSSQEGASISETSSIAIDNKQLSLPSNGDIINLEEEDGILMDYGFTFPNYDTNPNGVCFQDKANEIASTCYPNLDGYFGYADINLQGQKQNKSVINH